MSQNAETGFIGPATCPTCSSETRFWMQTNGRAMCPCTARNAFSPEELGIDAALAPSTD